MLPLAALLVLEAEASPEEPSPSPSPGVLCEEGDGEACYQLAMTTRQAMATGSEDAAFKLFGEACGLGYLPGCVAQAWEMSSRLYYSSSKLGEKREAARELFRMACDGGFGPGCAGLGTLELEYPEKRRSDIGAAADWFRLSCEHGDAMGCRLYGDMLYRGSGVGQDRAEAGRLYAAACDAGELRSCTQNALLVQQRSSEEAEGLLQASCEAGEPGACALQALNVLEAGDPDGAAKRILIDTCNQGGTISCAALGHAYVSRKMTNMPASYGRALLSKACSEDNALQCRVGGCEREFALACRWLAGDLAASGEKADRKRAGKLYGQACRGGDPQSCDR